MSRPRPLTALAGAALAALLTAAPARCQALRPPPRFADPQPSFAICRAGSGCAGASPGPLLPRGIIEAHLSAEAVAPVAFLASAALPGAGQYLLHEDRWVPYLAAELFGWWEYRRHHNAARGLERRYRDLAWNVARRVSVGPRRDSVFEYYEAMEHWLSSGSYDADPLQPGVDPETDTTTFNGHQWLLARRLYFGGVTRPPASIQYQQALAYYEANAIPPGYAWAWGDNLLEQRTFAELIRRGDDNFRAASRTLGLILANHVLSAVDAFIAARVRSEHPDAPRIRIEHDLDPTGNGLRLTAGLRVPLPER